MEWFDQVEFRVWVAKLFGLKKQAQVTPLLRTLVLKKNLRTLVR